MAYGATIKLTSWIQGPKPAFDIILSVGIRFLVAIIGGLWVGFGEILTLLGKCLVLLSIQLAPAMLLKSSIIDHIVSLIDRSLL